MHSLYVVWQKAHANSPLKRRYPTFAEFRDSEAVQRMEFEARYPRQAHDNIGFPDDWPKAPRLSDLFDPATAFDIGVSLPRGHPFAPVVDGAEAA